ncbi:PD-(D/E)XK nuclease family protein [Hymenobacter nivis]|nr:PD-(D/E)XK nuclease family protein [Hymenobacter nivis]
MTTEDFAALDGFFLTSDNWPVLAPAQPSFFSLAKIEHKELPLSNTYAFFFDSQGPHGLGNLFTRALLEVLNQKGHPLPMQPEALRRIQAVREYPIAQAGTPTKWLDLLLHNGHQGRPIPASATFAVLVEIKVWHTLHNDLTAYWHAIPTAEKRGIVLGFRKEEPRDKNWVFVTHLDVALAVEQQLKASPELPNPYYQDILRHFLDHIKHMSGATPDSFAEVFAYAQRHRAELNRAQQLLKQLQPAWLAEAIAAAFGDDYVQGSSFEDRVHISPKSGGPVDYLVWFGYLLQLDVIDPSFSITLFPTGGGENLPPDMRSRLIAVFKEAGRGVERLNWFDKDWYDEMLVGKNYYLNPANGTLDALKDQIRQALLEDWQPMKNHWVG